MSRVTRLKHVKREIEDDDFSLPTEKQRIVKVISSKGNNLHEVEAPDSLDPNFLVSMPNKFRKNLWIKRNNFVLVEDIFEGDKVKAEIVRILTAEHQKEFIKHGVWPKKFTKKRDHESTNQQEDNEGNSSDELHQNQNRRNTAWNRNESELASSSESD